MEDLDCRFAMELAVDDFKHRFNRSRQSHGQSSISIVNRQSQSSFDNLNRRSTITKSAIFSLQSAIDLVNHQLAFHALAAVVGGEVAVKAVGADLVGAELEDDGLAGAGALGDAVLIDREAVRDVLCRKSEPPPNIPPGLD